MSKLLEILVDITKDAFFNVVYFIKENMMRFVGILNFALPFVMYFIGRNSDSIWEGICIPLLFAAIMYYIKSAANKIGKGITVPVPDKRFTEVDDDGEVSIENNRVQELLLYTADLEDWLERKGLL